MPNRLNPLTGRWDYYQTGGGTAGPPGPPGPSYSDEQVRDVIAAALVAGSGVTVTVSDPFDTITIAATGSFVGALLTAVRETFAGPAATAVLADTPTAASERVVVDTLPQRRVSSGPGLNEYTLGGQTVTFGTALAVGEVAVVTYWTAMATARKEDFTGPLSTLVLATAPYPSSEIAVIDTTEQRLVGSSPGLNEYTLSGATLTLGVALAAGERAWVTYWTAAPNAVPHHDAFAGPASGLVLAAVPVASSEIVVVDTRHQRKVTSAPGLNEYTLSGSTITLGTALGAGEAAWVDYFA